MADPFQVGQAPIFIGQKFYGFLDKRKAFDEFFDIIKPTNFRMKDGEES